MQENDWNKPSYKISRFFTVKESLWLPQWNRMATEADGLDTQIKLNIIELANRMDVVRELLNASINVHCWFRPEAYNKLVKGAANSAHKYGQAVDFDAKGLTCDAVRAKLEPLLEQYKLRMEQMPGGTWVHLDTREPAPGGHRFFKP